MTHELKILPEYFRSVLCGDKTFEVRSKADREFHVGDILKLNEYDVDSGYTGRFIHVQVTYLLDDPAYCKYDFVILGFHPKVEIGGEN